jgi:hypothetical protein
MIHTCHKLVLQTNPTHQTKSSHESSFKLRRLWRSNHEEEEEEEEGKNFGAMAERHSEEDP